MFFQVLFQKKSFKSDLKKKIFQIFHLTLFLERKKKHQLSNYFSIGLHSEMCSLAFSSIYLLNSSVYSSVFFPFSKVILILPLVISLRPISLSETGGEKHFKDEFFF